MKAIQKNCSRTRGSSSMKETRARGVPPPPRTRGRREARSAAAPPHGRRRRAGRRSAHVWIGMGGRESWSRRPGRVKGPSGHLGPKWVSGRAYSSSCRVMAFMSNGKPLFPLLFNDVSKPTISGISLPDITSAETSIGGFSGSDLAFGRRSTLMTV